MSAIIGAVLGFVVAVAWRKEISHLLHDPGDRELETMVRELSASRAEFVARIQLALDYLDMEDGMGFRGPVERILRGED